MKNQAKVGEHRQECRKYEEQTQKWYEDQNRLTEKQVKGHTWTYAVFMCQMVLFGRSFLWLWCLHVCHVGRWKERSNNTSTVVSSIWVSRKSKGRESCKPWKKIKSQIYLSVYFHLLVSASYDISSTTCAPKLLLLTWKGVHVNFQVIKTFLRWFRQHVNAQ